VIRGSDVRERLAADRVMAILRYRDGGDVRGAVDGLASGGVRVLEITVDTPGALDAITHAAGLPGVVPGAGTVTDPGEVRRVAEAGARFVVSPGFAEDVVATALELGLEAFPAVATGTEVLAARRAGAQFFKLFPAVSLGVPHLRQLRGPFAALDFVPTGGIATTDIPGWLDAGAFAVAMGSALAGRNTPEGPAAVAALARRAAIVLAAAGDGRPR
jgi:2-dehydro-3-deoxyphosphogluconate aldolase/(4S)-4-hydroxy-2-oxoglutarate aldolase